MKEQSRKGSALFFKYLIQGHFMFLVFFRSIRINTPSPGYGKDLLHHISVLHFTSMNRALNFQQ